MSDTKRDIDGLIAALGHQKQCDEEGVLIAVSRQAVDEAMAALRALAAERERADRNQEDAERYRWLRDTDTAVVAWIEEDGPRWSIEGRDGHKITRDKLDAAIDAARRK